MHLLLAQLQDRLDAVAAYWKSQSAEALSKQPAPAKWSKKEILGHLADSAQNNIRRLVVGQYEEAVHIVYDQDAWVRAADYQHYDPIELLEFWTLLNRHFMRILATMPEASLESTTNWGREVPEYVTLRFVAQDYLRHLDHHLQQVYR